MRKDTTMTMISGVFRTVWVDFSGGCSFVPRLLFCVASSGDQHCRACKISLYTITSPIYFAYFVRESLSFRDEMNALSLVTAIQPPRRVS